MTQFFKKAPFLFSSSIFPSNILGSVPFPSKISSLALLLFPDLGIPVALETLPSQHLVSMQVRRECRESCQSCVLPIFQLRSGLVEAALNCPRRALSTPMAATVLPNPPGPAQLG